MNTFTKKVYSKILDTSFYISMSTYALRTMQKYGSLDNYLLLSNEKLLDSQFGRYLRAILKYKLKNPEFTPRKLPFTSKPVFKWKRREDHEYREVPSIYLPPEAKRQDNSPSHYPPEYFETRIEKEKRIELERKLENETDPIKKDELKKELNLGRHVKKLQDEMLTLMPFRHKLIRDTFMKYKDRTNAKLHLLQILEKSENYSKLILGEKYKHYSEDYPEVQLILQQTEQDKLKKNKTLAKMYKEYNFELGDISEQVSKHDPFKQKTGREYDIKKKPKTIKEEKERAKKKDITLKRKMVEKKKKESNVKTN